MSTAALVKDKKVDSYVVALGDHFDFHLQNGDRVHGAKVGWTNGEYTLMPVIDNLDPPTEHHSVSKFNTFITGDKIVRDYIYLEPDLGITKAKLIKKLNDDAYHRMNIHPVEVLEIACGINGSYDLLKASHIAETRRLTRDLISGATTVADAQKIFDDVVWP